MPRLSIRARKLTDGITHQAICRTCSFAGPIQDEREDAEGDAERHVLIPGNQNHRVGISTIETRVRDFKRNRN